MKVLIVLAALLALSPVVAPAYVLKDYKWQALPATYVTDPGMEEETAAAISRWSAVSGFRAVPGGEGSQIEVRLAFPDDHEYGGVALIWAADGAFTHCRINVNPDRWAADYPGDRMTILTHEMGHCMGIGHSDVPGSIMSTANGSTLTADDVAAARALYGSSPNRAFVPNLKTED